MGSAMTDYSIPQCAFDKYHDKPAIYVMGHTHTNDFEKYLNEEIGIGKDLYRMIRSESSNIPPIYIFLFIEEDAYQMVRFHYTQINGLLHV